MRRQDLSEAERTVLKQADRIRRDINRTEAKIRRKERKERAKAQNLDVARAALKGVENKFRQPRQRDAAYLSWLRRAPCIVCAIRGEVQVTRTDAAHVRRSYPEPGWRPVGGAEKPSDPRAIPLCRSCHVDQHQHDNHAFYAELGIYPPSVCFELKAAQMFGADPVETVQNIAAEIRSQK